MSYVFMSFAGLFVVTQGCVGDGEYVGYLSVGCDGRGVVGRRRADLVLHGAQADPCHALSQNLGGNLHPHVLVARKLLELHVAPVAVVGNREIGELLPVVAVERIFRRPVAQSALCRVVAAGEDEGALRGADALRRELEDQGVPRVLRRVPQLFVAPRGVVDGQPVFGGPVGAADGQPGVGCLLYTSDAADE